MRERGTHDCLAVLEDELLVELREVEPVLALARLDVDLCEELADELDDLGDRDLVRVVVGRLLERRFEEKRVPGEARRRLGQVAVKLELARLGQALGFLWSVERISRCTQEEEEEEEERGGRTSTNLANAGLLPFSFSNSYLPYSWCAPYLT